MTAVAAVDGSDVDATVELTLRLLFLRGGDDELKFILGNGIPFETADIGESGLGTGRAS